MKSHTTPSPTTFKQLNDEINDFYNHLKDNKHSDAEIRKIFTPFLTPTSPTPKPTIILTCVIIITIIYLSSYIETIAWHCSAVARILLIKLLPFWDWPRLKNEKCLLLRSTPPPTQDPTFNCALCEHIQQIDEFDDISQDVLKNRYIDVDVPVIVKTTWSKPNFIEELVQNPEIARSKPCSLSTNVHNGATTVKNLVRRTRLFDSFFVQFQNCDFAVVKQFRVLAPRPPFLPPELSPVQYNWLLWSKNYNVSQFKAVGLVEKVAVVGQILGGNFVRLIPRNNCEEECPVVEVGLKEGEALVFTSLWDLEYRPDLGENVAVVLELH